MHKMTIPALALAALLIITAHVGKYVVDRPVKATPARAQADPSGLVILTDVSASMSGPKLARAKEAVRQATAGLADGTVVGLRTFSSTSNLITLPSANGKAEIFANVDSLSTITNTDIGLGLRGAVGDIELVRSRGGPARWTIVLVSDGLGNAPHRDLEAARELAARCPFVTCHTIGIELDDQGRQELAEIARIFSGRNWTVGRDQLASTLSQAVSLAGFTGTAAAPVPARSEEGTWGLAFVMLLGIGFVLSARRTDFSEGTFTVLVAAAAGALAWIGTQALMPAVGTSSMLLALVQCAAYFALAGGIFGALLSAAEGLYLNEPRRAASAASAGLAGGIFGGALAGLAGQAFFATVRGALGHTWILAYLTRAAGWSVAGAIVGACPGLVAASRRRMINGAMGGAIGGAVGGWLFEAFVSMSSSTASPRLVALMSLGVAIGAMVRVVEEMRKQAWLVLLKGGPEGKEFIVAKEITTLGSHYQDDVCVPSDRGHPQREAVLRLRDGRYELETVSGGRASVNNAAATRTVLRHGDVIAIGEGELLFQLRDVQPEDAEIARAHAGAQALPSYSVAVLPSDLKRAVKPDPSIEWVADDEPDDGQDAKIEFGDVRTGAPRRPKTDA